MTGTYADEGEDLAPLPPPSASPSPPQSPPVRPEPELRRNSRIRLMAFVDHYQKLLIVQKNRSLCSYPFFNVLLEIANSRLAGKSICVTDVGLETNVPQTTALRAMGELEDIGLIVRMPDPQDRRRVFVDLTPQGLAELSAIADEIQEIDAAFLRGAGFD